MGLSNARKNGSSYKTTAQDVRQYMDTIKTYRLYLRTFLNTMYI
jgi:hypothetical protein